MRVCGGNFNSRFATEMPATIHDGANRFIGYANLCSKIYLPRGFKDKVKGFIAHAVKSTIPGNHKQAGRVASAQ